MLAWILPILVVLLLISCVFLFACFTVFKTSDERAHKKQKHYEITYYDTIGWASIKRKEERKDC